MDGVPIQGVVRIFAIEARASSDKPATVIVEACHPIMLDEKGEFTSPELDPGVTVVEVVGEGTYNQWIFDLTGAGVVELSELVSSAGVRAPVGDPAVIGRAEAAASAAAVSARAAEETSKRVAEVVSHAAATLRVEVSDVAARAGEYRDEAAVSAQQAAGQVGAAAEQVDKARAAVAQAEAAADRANAAPEGGWPVEKLSAGVKASLVKAESALQKVPPATSSQLGGVMLSGEIGGSAGEVRVTGAVASITPSVIVRRDNDSQIFVPSEQTSPNHAVSRACADSRYVAKTALSQDAAAYTIAQRSSTGALAVAEPAVGSHAATKSYVDARASESKVYTDAKTATVKWLTRTPSITTSVGTGGVNTQRYRVVGDMCEIIGTIHVGKNANLIYNQDLFVDLPFDLAEAVTIRGHGGMWLPKEMLLFHIAPVIDAAQPKKLFFESPIHGNTSLQARLKRGNPGDAWAVPFLKGSSLNDNGNIIDYTITYRVA